MTFFKRNWLPLVLSLVVAFLILFPYLVGGQIIRGNGDENVIAYYAFLKDAFKGGQSPFWNPANGAGFPLFITNGHPFFPLNFLLLFLSPVAVHNLGLFLILALALFFTILFIRMLGGGLAAAVIGGVGYLTSQIVYENNFITAIAIVFLPFFFWVLVKFIESDSTKRRWGWGILAALAVGLLWWGGGSNFQFGSYVLIGGFVFALYYAWQKKKPVLKIAGWVALIVVVGTIIGLAELLPALAVAQASHRAGGFAFSYVIRAAPIRLTDLILFLNPFFSGRSAETFLYMGLVPLVLFVTSFFIKIPQAKFFRWLFFITFAIALYKSPLLWIIQQIPLLNYFRHPSRFMILGSFAAAISAALAAEAVFDKLKNKFLANGKSVMSGTIIFLLVVFTILDYKFVFAKRFEPETAASRLVVENNALDSLKKLEKGRILAVLPDDGYSVFYWSLAGQAPPRDYESTTRLEVSTLYPNFNLLYGLESIELSDPLLPRDLGRFLTLISARQLADYGEVEPHSLNVPESDKLRLLHSRRGLLNFLGVRYLLSAFDLSEAGFRVRHRADIVIPEFAVQNYVLSFGVYENLDAKPLFYFAPVTGVAPDRESAHQAFRKSNFEGIFVECADCGPTGLDSATRLTVSQKSATDFTLTTDVSKEQFLVFSQNYLPGWRATIDGAPSELFRVNSIFMGTFVPAGEHEVKFSFSYRDMIF